MKMKKTILLIMLIFIPSVLAITGGETWIYHFDECDKLRVNITGNLTIDNGEYTIHNDCIETEANYFICNCSNNFDLNVSFEINTINNYTFSFNYDYTKEVADSSSSSSSSSSSGSSGGSLYYICSLKRSINNSYCRNTFCPRYSDINNCSKTPGSDHLCCITYFEEDKKVFIIPNETINIDIPLYIIDTIEENKTIIIPEEEVKKSNMLRNIIITLLAIFLICIMSFAIWIRREIE